ncbi:MAG: FAD-dependent oxidoreductase [bacterium]
MLVDISDIEQDSSIDCDLCIIGAGAAGITIAREFDGTGMNVWLLESGGLEFEQDTQDLYVGASSGRKYFPLDETRLRYLGGTTNHWAGLCRPLDEIDFEVRDWVPHSGWPFDRDHLMSWYRRAEIVCELPGHSYDTDSWLPESEVAIGFDPQAIRSEVYLSSTPTRFGKRYRGELSESGNIRLCLHANVTNLQLDEGNARINRVQIKTLNGRRFAIKPGACVIASGSIENARLLLVSNSQQKKGLGNNYDNVGRYFMDHLVLDRGGAIVSNVAKIPEAYYNPYLSRRRRPTFFTLLMSTDMQRRYQVLNYSTMFFSHALPDGVRSYRQLQRKLERDEPIDDWSLHLGKILGDVDDVAKAFYHDYLTDQPRPIMLDLYNQWEQAPNPESRVTLTSDLDVLGMPRVNVDWKLSELDTHTLSACQQVLAHEAGSSGLGRVKVAIKSGEELPERVRGDNHQMGTTRMHRDASSGVVDPDCRVHSVDNLYIAGGSVFPTCGSTNPTLTVVALSLRLSDHIKQKMT